MANATVLRIRHIGQDEVDDFTVIDMKQLATMLPGITSILTKLLSAVAAVCLLVGGIGIMIIMQRLCCTNRLVIRLFLTMGGFSLQPQFWVCQAP